MLNLLVGSLGIMITLAVWVRILMTLAIVGALGFFAVYSLVNAILERRN